MLNPRHQGILTRPIWTNPPWLSGGSKESDNFLFLLLRWIYRPEPICLLFDDRFVVVFIHGVRIIMARLETERILILELGKMTRAEIVSHAWIWPNVNANRFSQSKPASLNLRTWKLDNWTFHWSTSIAILCQPFQGIRLNVDKSSAVLLGDFWTHDDLSIIKVNIWPFELLQLSFWTNASKKAKGEKRQ